MGESFFSRLNCYLTGHEYSIRQAGGRMFLLCSACGHRSDGVVLTGRQEPRHPETHRPRVMSPTASSSEFSSREAH